jgi:hypothetical protein
MASENIDIQGLVFQGQDYNCAGIHASLQKRTVLPFSPI